MQKCMQDTEHKTFPLQAGLSNPYRLAEICLIMCCAPAFAAEKTRVPHKLPDYSLISTLCNPAEMVLAETVIAALAWVISLAHIEPSLIIMIETFSYIILIMDNNELFKQYQEMGRNRQKKHFVL